jgi:tetratricopeptide (TPR) repeat protein
MSKRAVFYLVAGVFCAGAAVVVALRGRSAGSGGGQNIKFTQILLATKDIEVGSRISVGKGEEVNAKLIQWPDNLVLEGAITDDKDVQGKNLVAVVKLVKHQPVLKRLIAEEAEFIKPGMYPERITVDKLDLALWTPGMRVDVSTVSEGKQVTFIRCARIYAVGTLPRSVVGPAEPPKKDQKASEIPPCVYILLPAEFKKAFVEATLGGTKKPALSLAEGECGEMPAIVAEAPDARETVLKEIEAANALLANNNAEEALVIFERIAAEYPNLEEAKQAAGLAQKCKEALAEKVYEEAEAALQAGEPTLCLARCTMIKDNYPDASQTLGKVKDLVARATELSDQKQRASAYEAACKSLEESLGSGDIPRAETILTEITENFSGFVPPDPLKSPEKLTAEYTPQIEKAKGDLEAIKRLFLYYMRDLDVRDNRARALEKYRLMKEKFPAHPFIKEAEAQLREAGLPD